MNSETVQELGEVLSSYGIPEAVKIAGQIFRVGSLHPLSRKSLEGDYTFGLCNFRDNEIGLAEDVHPLRAWSTLFHEAIEAICEMYQIDIEHKDIQILEAGIFDFCISNGLLDLPEFEVHSNSTD